MKERIHTPQNRLVSFDNLCYLMVLLVPVFHLTAGYGIAPRTPFVRLEPQDMKE